MEFKESESIELKKSTSELKEAIISISAILNKHGKGTVYFGIDDTGKVIGQQIGKTTLSDISKSISDHIEPKIYPDIQKRKMQGKDYVIAHVTGQNNVYSAFGRYYLRIGNENKKLSVDELRHLVEKKNNYAYSWGSEPSDLSISKAEVSIIKKFVEKGRKVGRIEYAYDSARNILHKLNLTKGNKLLNAGRALFCENSGIEVQTAVFAGKDKVTFIDIQSFRDSLFNLINKCETYVKEHINWRADLSGSTRVEVPEIPVRAIKEAIVNSLCHRDFNDPKSNEIAIYRDRIEIYNPGQFPFDHDPAEFIAGKGKSYPRNPLIAEAFYLAKEIERWGSGIKRITEECNAAGIKVIFEKIDSGFQVTFYRSKAIVIKKTLEGIIKGEEEKPMSDTAKQVRRKYGESAEKVFVVIAVNPYIKTHEISDKTNLAQRTVEKAIAILKKESVLKRIGPDKGGHWEVVKKW